MRLLPITSSSVAAIGWKAYLSPENLGFLGVLFQNGTAYVYEGVPIEAFVGTIMDPESQGKAFQRLVKDPGYPYHKSDLEELGAI